MSEKKLRDAMRYVRRDRLTAYSGLRAIEEALAQPPDLVVLLRWAKALEEKYNVVGNIGSQLDELTFPIVIRQIQKTVRLTDDGWEWVE